MKASEQAVGRDIRPATMEQLVVIVEAMPPARRLVVLLGAWCALRRGELLELRRKDVDLAAESSPLTATCFRYTIFGCRMVT